MFNKVLITYHWSQGVPKFQYRTILLVIKVSENVRIGVGIVYEYHTFFRKMPWKAPYVRDGKGASSGEVVEGSGGKADEGK